MLKNIALFWCVLIGSSFFFAGPLYGQLTFNAQKLTPGLIFQIYEEDKDTYEVLVVLEEQMDVESMKDHFARNEVNADQRSAYVIQTLKNIANASQASFMNDVRALADVDENSLESFWVVNAVLMQAGIEAITEMSHWSNVRMIEHNDQPELIMPVATNTATSVPNGHEIGHNIINAPAMWALGYTGYGRKALIIDSGNDPTHHALMTNFWWHNAPIEEAWTGFGDFAEDCGSHGSHVNGTVNGLNRYTNDTIGVAFNAHWQGGPMGFAIGNGCSRPFYQNIRSTFQSFQWAMNPDGDPNTSSDKPDVINCSWTSGQYGCTSGSSITVLDNVLTAGIAVVWANGNAGPAPATVCCAQGINASLVNSFTVGAVNSNSVIAGFSSRGPSPCSQVGGSLAIKPEVSAPGVSIRSSVPGNGYSNFNGTSMAAPHVSGAILLLKEAFPYLDGETLMLALYYSAVDKGVEGEDNDYGMGIIDVFAAYEYLIDEGNVAVPPVSADNDVVLVEVIVPSHAYCLNTASPELIVQNAGLDTVFSLTVSYSFANPSSPTGSLPWEGVLAPGEITSIQLPVFGNLPAGLHELWSEISLPNGEPDPRDLNNRFKVRFEVLDLPNLEAEVSDIFADAVCPGSSVIVEIDLDVEDTDMVEWFDAPVGGNLLGSGPVLVTEPLLESTTVYADIKTVSNAGKPQNLPGQQDFVDDNQVGLLFDVYEPINLKSVLVYAEETGTRLIQLQDAQGNSMGLRAVTVDEIGANRIELNFQIPPGTDYRLIKFAGKPLGINFNGNFYPYTVQDILSVRRTIGLDFEAQNLARYYYFYDWRVETMYACGRKAVQIEVGEGIAAQINLSADAEIVELSNGTAQVNLTASAAGVQDFFWNFGNETTQSGSQVIATYSAPGTYLVTAAAIDSTGCANAASIVITVVENTVSTIVPDELQSLFFLYPNPTTTVLNLVANGHETTLETAVIHDMTGRKVAHHSLDLMANEPLELNIARLPAGVYAITVYDVAGNQWSNRFVKK